MKKLHDIEDVAYELLAIALPVFGGIFFLSVTLYFILKMIGG